MAHVAVVEMLAEQVVVKHGLRFADRRHETLALQRVDVVSVVRGRICRSRNVHEGRHQVGQEAHVVANLAVEAREAPGPRNDQRNGKSALVGTHFILAQRRIADLRPRQSVGRSHPTVGVVDIGHRTETGLGVRFGAGAVLNPANLIDAKKVELKTEKVSLSIDPEYSHLVEAKVIDGQKVLIVPVEDHLEFNGVAVNVNKDKE